MDIYTIKSIEEAVYGCEECEDGARALVTLAGAAGETKTEMTEDWLAFIGAAEGTELVLCADGKYRPLVKVAAAVIVSDSGEMLAAQRGSGEYKGRWEFPGGKVEVGETPQQALVREIKEELDADISIDGHICTAEYDYPRFRLYMDCFLAGFSGGRPVLKEHTAVKWLTADTLDTLDWLPADKAVVKAVKQHIKKSAY